MNKISYKFFMYLTNEILNNGRKIEEFINSKDGNLYLVKYRDKKLYFIVGGRFILTANNDIDYHKSDSCLFAKDCITSKYTTLDTTKIMKCLEVCPVNEYINEVRDIYDEYLQSKVRNSFQDNIKKFNYLCQQASNLLKRCERGEGEDIFIYAKRIADNSIHIQAAKYILYYKDLMERIWIKALYDQIDLELYKRYLYKILKRIISKI